jgi:hypothetical protein
MKEDLRINIKMIKQKLYMLINTFVNVSKVH